MNFLPGFSNKPALKNRTKECLRLLLKGRTNIIFCPAREIGHLRLSKEWRPALDENRMLILSPSLKNAQTPEPLANATGSSLIWLKTFLFLNAAPHGHLESIRRIQ